jgi:DegV family protein with EDD domain
MSKIKIITDSACDLDIDYLKQLDIHLVPMTVHFGEENYFDRVTITTTEFYGKLKESNQMPKTSQINPNVFVEEFKKYLDDGFHIICICFSSRLSGTYQSACIAKEMLEAQDIDIIDSMAASVGQGLIVREAALMNKSGRSGEEIIDRINFMKNRMEHIFAVGSLEMLKRGGRITRAQAVMGTLLNVKPILQIQDGYIIPYEKVRGKNAIVKKMIETMKERGHNLEKQIIGLNFAGESSMELLSQLKDEIAKEFGVTDFVVSEIGAAIGSHAGPGTVSVFFLRK